MEKRKLTKEDLDKVRHIEGFPIGKDEDIIALSDPPYYTACPNPFIADFIKEHGTPYDETTDDYHREPFASDVSEGKYHPLYRLHPYHTKVPHKVIVRYILHYTNPGDLLLDGFAGTGMTGVAARICQNPNDELRREIEIIQPGVKWGERNAILVDLSPIASFISYAGNLDVDIEKLQEEINDILSICDKECGWMFETKHIVEGKEHGIGKISYVTWSNVYICPNCSKEFVFWEDAVDEENGKVLNEFICHNCGAKLKKNTCTSSKILCRDIAIGENINCAKQVPVRIHYTYHDQKYEKIPDESDFNLIKKINAYKIPYWYPSNRMCEGREARRNDDIGITHVHHFYTKRNLAYLACFNYHCRNSIHKVLLTRVLFRITKRYALTYMKGCWGAGGGPTAGTLYIPALMKELPIGRQIVTAVKPVIEALSFLRTKSKNIISNQSSADLKLVDDNSIDYIFIDPPFGNNLMYSELNFIWESWLKVVTQKENEVIVSDTQGKGVRDYQNLMVSSLKEFYRVLKPNRWITVEFHNSKNEIWNSIQEAMQMAGFIIADVRVLDKKKGSFVQTTTTSAVKQDLIISAYKPKNSFTTTFTQNVGTEETAWAFVRQHLANLPVVVKSSGKIETVTERQAFLLFDRMVAYHIMQGLPVPIDAADFYKGLDDRFLKRDSMYFLPDQVTEYDLARSSMELEKADIALFVTDEKSAIGWLYVQLDEKNGGKRQTYQVLQPKFMQEVRTVKRTEKMPELITMLEENFLEDDSGAWYVPDLAKSGDVAKLREKNLLKEFQEYQATKGKLKVFRSEAIRVGFAKLWKDKEYKAIVALAERLPEETVQEDPNILMYYDISLSRV